MSTRRSGPRSAARFPRGMPADRRSRIRGIPIAWQRWRAGAVLEAAAGGGGAPGLKAAATGGGASGLGRRLHAVSLVCTERRLRARRNRPAACCRRRISGGRWRCCRWCPSICCCTTARALPDGAAQQSAGPGRLVRARRAHPQERAAGAGAGPHRPRGTGPARNGRRLDALRRPRAFLLHQLRRRNQPLHPLHRAGLRGRAGAGSGQPAARAASRLPLAVARRHRRRP